MKASKRQKLIALLVLRNGYSPEETRSTKYLHFKHVELSTKGGFWLGKSGAVRIGPLASVSTPVVDSVKNELNRQADEYWETLDRAEQKSIVEQYPQPKKQRR